MGQSEEREGMNRDFTLFIFYARSGEAGCMRCALHHEMLWHGYYPNVPFVNDELLLTKARYSDLSTLAKHRKIHHLQLRTLHTTFLIRNRVPSKFK